MHRYSYGKRRKIFANKKRFLGSIIAGFGLVSLLYIFFPVISYHIYLSSAFAGGNIKSPLPQRFVLSGGDSLAGFLTKRIANVGSDYSDARNWFPYQTTENTQKKVTEYEFSIPSLNITNSKVSAIDFDLSKHLVQYFTTSKSPVEKGTSVIFGHSTLPQWFDPNNYMTIFARLHLIKNGEEIILTVDGVDYKYKVFEISIMDADDPNIFSQAYDNSYVTVVTCTPPGTIWKRLVVRASLVGNDKFSNTN